LRVKKRESRLTLHERDEYDDDDDDDNDEKCDVNGAIINNNYGTLLKHHFGPQNYHWHDKGFLQNL
jgi:hypothetical protein